MASPGFHDVHEGAESEFVLRDKTEGNRSAEETQTLDELIYDLQLRYVKATASPG